MDDADTKSYDTTDPAQYTDEPSATEIEAEYEEHDVATLNEIE